MDDQLRAMLDANRCEQPEKNFDATVLAYTAIELEEFIDDFASAKEARPVYGWVLALLEATVAFDYSGAPEEIFTEMRANKSAAELNNIFTTMQTAYTQAQSHLQDTTISEQDKIILEKALNYSKTCILHNMNEFSVGDPLLTNWDQSELKKLL